jgi:acetoin utilization protein AcuB
MWEINYLLSKLTVEKVMSREVVRSATTHPSSGAARIMADRGIGGAPAMYDLVGIITETDLFKLFLEFMGARERGVRATLLVKEEKGGLAYLARAIADAGGNIVAMGLFRGEDAGSRTATVKVGGISAEALEKAIRPHALRMIDIRTL